MRASSRGIPVLNLPDKMDALQECIQNDSTEDSIGHLFDLLHLVVPGYSFSGDTWNFKNITELCEYYGKNPAPIKGGKMQIMSETHRLIYRILGPVRSKLRMWDFYPNDEVVAGFGLPDCDVYIKASKEQVVLSATIKGINMCISIDKESEINDGRDYNISDPKSIERVRNELGEWFNEIDDTMTWSKWRALITKWNGERP